MLHNNSPHCVYTSLRDIPSQRHLRSATRHHLTIPRYTGSALSVVGPSMSPVRRSGTRYQTVSVTWRSPATASDNRWKRTYFVATTQHTQYSRDASWLLLYKSIIDIDTKPRKHHKMSTVSPDTSRETATPLTDGCNNNRMVKLPAFDQQSLFQFCMTSLK